MRKFDRNDRVLLICVAVARRHARPDLRLGAALSHLLPGDGLRRHAADRRPPLRPAIVDRSIQVRFDANVGQGLPWEFRPERVSIELRLGENKFGLLPRAQHGDKPIAGKASFNVTPLKAANIFQQDPVLLLRHARSSRPARSRDMGVSFFVDPSDRDRS